MGVKLCKKVHRAPWESPWRSTPQSPSPTDTIARAKPTPALCAMRPQSHWMTSPSLQAEMKLPGEPTATIWITSAFNWSVSSWHRNRWSWSHWLIVINWHPNACQSTSLRSMFMVERDKRTILQSNRRRVKLFWWRALYHGVLFYCFSL